MKAFRAITFLVTSLLLVGLTALVVGVGRYGFPPRSVAALRGLAVLFLLNDVLVGATLIGLLVTRERWIANAAHLRLPISPRRLWALLVVLAVLAYASLSPVFLYVLIRMRRPP